MAEYVCVALCIADLWVVKFSVGNTLAKIWERKVTRIESTFGHSSTETRAWLPIGILQTLTLRAG